MNPKLESVRRTNADTSNYYLERIFGKDRDLVIGSSGQKVKLRASAGDFSVIDSFQETFQTLLWVFCNFRVVVAWQNWQ